MSVKKKVILTVLLAVLVGVGVYLGVVSIENLISRIHDAQQAIQMHSNLIYNISITKVVEYSFYLFFVIVSDIVSIIIILNLWKVFEKKHNK